MVYRRIFMEQITTGSTRHVSPLLTSAQGPWGCAAIIQELTPVLKDPWKERQMVLLKIRPANC